MSLISKNKAVSLRYTLTDPSGKKLDASAEGKPLWYLHGYRNIVPGLERALEGKQQGDSFKVEVPPTEGYGEKRKVKLMELRRSVFPKGATPKRGDNFMLQSPKGPVPVWVQKVQGPTIFVSPLHPLSGVRLCFDVEVLEVRDASEEEIAHGHVHGPGAHQHEDSHGSEEADEEEASEEEEE